MRILMSLLIIVGLQACSHSPQYNENVVELIEETLSIKVEDKGESLDKVYRFISNLNKRESNSFYEIEYQPQFGDMISELTFELRALNITPARYKFDVSEDANSSHMKVKAFYRQYKGNECGELNFHNRKEYRFGCSIEYNRNISLVNSFK